MRIRTLVVSAVAGMLLSCTVVYHHTPPGPSPATAVSTVSPVATVGKAVAPAEDGASEPSPLSLETRVGHQAVSAGGRTFILLEVRGNESETFVRTRTSTALVIDTSGSMAGERISHALAAARGWMSRTHHDDFAAAVGFADTARSIALSHIDVGGSTCISCGIRSGLAMLPAADGRVRRLIVLSDGQANRGITDAAGLSELAAGFRERGVSITTVGVGADYNEQSLTALAAGSNGLHHFVSSPSDLPAVFERESLALRSTVANDAVVNVSLAPGVELARVYERPHNRDGRTVRVHLGSISEGDSRTVMLEVQLDDTIGERALADVEVTLQDPARAQPVSMRRSLTTEVTAGTSGALDPLVEMRLWRSRTADAIGRASQSFSRGMASAAIATMRQHETTLAEAAQRAVERALSRGDEHAAAIREDFDRQRNNAASARKNFTKVKPRSVEGRHAVKRAFVHKMELGY